MRTASNFVRTSVKGIVKRLVLAITFAAISAGAAETAAPALAKPATRIRAVRWLKSLDEKLANVSIELSAVKAGKPAKSRAKTSSDQPASGR